MIKKITFSADEYIIRKAREKAHKEKHSLNVIFRRWLTNYVMGGEQPTNYYALMKKLKHIKVGKPFSRDELNEDEEKH